MLSPDEITRRARAIRLLCCDVDGVLTDGRLYYDEDGRQTKAFSSLDGQWLRFLMSTGVEVAWITGSRSVCVQRRADDLGITRVFQGHESKRAVWEELLAELSLPASACAHVGDDVPDVPLFLRCGLAMSVPNAPIVVRSHAHHVTSVPGGRGAVREICELLMRAQGTLEPALARFLA